MQDSEWLAKFDELRAKGANHWQRRQRSAVLGGILMGLFWAALDGLAIWQQWDPSFGLIGLLATFFIARLVHYHYGILRGAASGPPGKRG